MTLAVAAIPGRKAIPAVQVTEDGSQWVMEVENAGNVCQLSLLLTDAPPLPVTHCLSVHIALPPFSTWTPLGVLHADVHPSEIFNVAAFLVRPLGPLGRRFASRSPRARSPPRPPC